MAKKSLRKSGLSWPLEQRPGYLIRRLHQIHVALFQKECAAFEITPLQYSLLTALAVRGTADQTTLAADVALDRTTFVERSVLDRDRRAQTCRVTRKGLALLEKMEQSAQIAHLKTVSDLSKADQKRFIAMMRRIVTARSKRQQVSAAASD